MNRFESHFAKLYATEPTDIPSPAPLISTGSHPHTRLLVMDVQGSQAWSALAKVWEGVQADWEWPAPGIVVSGKQSFQLWFSLATPQPTQAVHDAGLQLVASYLGDVKPALVTVYPHPAQASSTATPPGTESPWQHVPHRPLDSPVTDQWCACVARDLAPVFADTPWLDIPPNPEGQADLLSTLRSLPNDRWQALVTTVHPSPSTHPSVPPVTPRPAGASTSTSHPNQDPRQFLLDVMNDTQVDIRWRIEAAKALLNGR